MKETKKERLSKVLARAGVASRRKCEELIFEGRVTVNKEIALISQMMVSLDEDSISVDGDRVAKMEDKVVYALNKPKGYLCTNECNDKVKNRVVDLIKGYDSRRLYTIGRLDKDTTGLILLTNDGHFAQEIAHPSKQVEKEYLVKVNKEVLHDHLVEIAKGTYVEGKFVRPKEVKKVRKGTLRITVTDGRKREVRTLVEKIGFEIYELTRIRIANLLLGKLAEGAFRRLNEKEQAELLRK